MNPNNEKNEHYTEIIEDIVTLSDKSLVSICCITYNHENFISEAIQGFLMQKTEFPFEIIIRDDASTDKTADIVHRYQADHPNLISVIYHAQNQFSLGIRAFPEVFMKASGKYIALCEGDDYWTDPLKLQKQVDFLEAHPECSICGHRVLRKIKGDEEKSYFWPKYTEDRIFTKDEFYGKYILQTCSVVFTNSKIEALNKFSEGFKVGDYPLFYFYAQLGDVGYLHDVMAVYRIHNEGVSSGLSHEKKLVDFYDTLDKLKERLNIKSQDFDHEMMDQLLKIIDYYDAKRNDEKSNSFLKEAWSKFFIASHNQKKNIIKHSFQTAFRK